MNDAVVYDRQKQLKLTACPQATVVGVGGTGAWVAIIIAMSGCQNLHLMDADKLEVTNFNRVPLNPDTNTGRSKVEALKEFIENIRPDINISIYGRAGTFTLPLTEGVIFDCTDNHDTQIMVNEWAKKNARPYIRCGYDGTHITVTHRMPKWTTGEKHTGYEVFPSWVVPAIIASALAVAKVMKYPDMDVTIDVGEIGVKPE